MRIVFKGYSLDSVRLLSDIFNHAVRKEPLRCKLEHQGQVLEQAIPFNYYLEVMITSSGILAREIIHQAVNVSACLNESIWLDNVSRKESKERFISCAADTDILQQKLDLALLNPE